MLKKHFLVFRKAEKKEVVSYDKERQKPMLKCSICNGEQVAGFRDRKTGTFVEVMLITDEDDLKLFCNQYGITEPIEKFY